MKSLAVGIIILAMGGFLGVALDLGE